MQLRLKHPVSLLVLLLAVTVPACGRDHGTLAAPSSPEVPDSQWEYFAREARINQLLFDASARFKPATIVIENVVLVPMTEELTIPNMAVLVENGTIAAIGKSGAVSIPDGATSVSGEGAYLIPGLTDMHVHTGVSYSQDILNLAKGVTSVREMCGFDWILKLRDKTVRSEWLGPNLYVAGHILNSFPMGPYATLVRTPEQAREAVRRQAAAGFDFIKIHNGMRPDVYKAVFDEARKHNLDVVGHIPQQIKLEEAMAAGQRTLEHFKGYILDKDLSLTSEDYVLLTRNGNAWNCPTFYNVRAGLRGDRAHQFLTSGLEAAYVSPTVRREWNDIAAGGGQEATDRVFELSKRIFTDLKGQYGTFLAGTDCGGGYPFMVPGFALHDELRMFDDLGMSPFEALRSATRNAAVSMRRENEFGTIEVGKRADFVLLTKNPLESATNLDSINGVCVRGIWLHKSDVEELLHGVATIYAGNNVPEPYTPPTQAEAEDLVKSFEDQSARGLVHKDLQLADFAALLNSRGMAPLANRIRHLMTSPQVPGSA